MVLGVCGKATVGHGPVLTLAIMLGLSGCQHYQPEPLPTDSTLATSATALGGSSEGEPLQLDDIDRLVLQNNPELKAARARLGVAEAALIQSGILSNPTLSGAFLPQIAGSGVTSWNVSLTHDLRSLITYKSQRRATQDLAQQGSADLLWQEWQTLGHARQLAINLAFTRRQLDLANAAVRVFTDRYLAAEQSVQAGQVTLSTADPSLSTFQLFQKNAHALEEQELKGRHALAALLGLSPESQIPLAPSIALPAFDLETVRAALDTLADRRPDLLALRLGYAAQEEYVREAILLQFSDLVLGLSASSDEPDLTRVGPEASIGLPIFDRGQGKIASARATRKQLWLEYDARLKATVGEAESMSSELELAEAQLQKTQDQMPDAEKAAASAMSARSRSVIDEASYINLVSRGFSLKLEIMSLQQNIAMRQVALQTLLGVGLPRATEMPGGKS